MKNYKILLVILLLISVSIHIKAQNSIQRYNYFIDKVSYSIQCFDKIYKTNDTIEFTIEVTNNRKK